jgi:carboxymuconolactone decarboxylase family protein
VVTEVALIALNRPDQLRSHRALARRNGVTEEELIETITHMAFYSGWPSAVSAIPIAKEIFQKKGGTRNSVLDSRFRGTGIEALAWRHRDRWHVAYRHL